MKSNDNDYEKKRWVGCQAGPFRYLLVFLAAHQDKRRQRAMTKHDHQQQFKSSPLYFHTIFHFISFHARFSSKDFCWSILKRRKKSIDIVYFDICHAQIFFNRLPVKKSKKDDYNYESNGSITIKIFRPVLTDQWPLQRFNRTRSKIMFRIMDELICPIWRSNFPSDYPLIPE